jgi:hypothetical protein
VFLTEFFVELLLLPLQDASFATEVLSLPGEVVPFLFAPLIQLQGVCHHWRVHLTMVLIVVALMGLILMAALMVFIVSVGTL